MPEGVHTGGGPASLAGARVSDVGGETAPFRRSLLYRNSEPAPPPQGAAVLLGTRSGGPLWLPTPGGPRQRESCALGRERTACEGVAYVSTFPVLRVWEVGVVFTFTRLTHSLVQRSRSPEEG